jgi:hypothetical protein
MIREDSQHPIVIAAADQATAGIPDGQIERAIAAVHRWVKSHVRFVQDSALAASLSGFVPEETEVLIRPADLLAMPQPQGDCDDYAMAAGAILAALGIPVALVTIAGDPATPNTYSHVYLLAAAPNGAIAVDASHGPRSSWYAPAAGKAKIWEVQPVITRAPGLGAIDWNSIIQTGVKAGAQIATNVTMPSGTYQQAGPQGTVVYRQPEGANALSFPTTQLSGSFSPILALAAIGGILLLLATRSRG